MMLCADAISVVRNGTTLLNSISAQFPAGKVTAILGPNGAGKSTLLSCLAGIDRPTTGSIILDGKPLHKMPTRKRARQIGLLPQGGELNWDITARQLVALGQMPYQGNFGLCPDGFAKIDAAMATTDTARYGGRNMLSLSGGERARVLLARVLAGEPRWLLADEPLANLDLGHQIDLLNLLRVQADAGTGVIVVLHDLNQAAIIADHVVLLNGGTVAASGTTEGVLTQANLTAVFGIDVAIARDPHNRLHLSLLGRKS